MSNEGTKYGIRERARNGVGVATRKSVSRLISYATEPDESIAPEIRAKVADDLFENLPGNCTPPSIYCYTFDQKIVILLGKEKYQISDVKNELENLGAKVLHYCETDRLLVEIIQDGLPITNLKDIALVVALIDFWPGRRNVLDFGIKIKTLLPNVRTVIMSAYEAQDDISKIGKPPIDAVVRYPLHPCMLCRVVHQE
jgi:hypothetical protein